MDYVYLALAVLCCVGQVVTTKEYQRRVPTVAATGIAFYLVLNTVSTLIFVCKAQFRIAYSDVTMALSVAIAVLMLVYQLVSIKILSLGSVAVFSMFLMLGGMILPFLYGVIFLAEPLGWAKCLGLVLLTFFLIWQTAGGERGGARGKGFYALCLLMFFLNGAVSILVKLHQVHPLGVDAESFTVLRSGVSVVIGALALGFCGLRPSGRGTLRRQLVGCCRPQALAASVLNAVVSSLGAFFLLVAAATAPASVQYPMVSGGTVVLSSLSAVLFFRERPKKREIFCIIGIFAATFLFLF